MQKLDAMQTSSVKSDFYRSIQLNGDQRRSDWNQSSNRKSTEDKKSIKAGKSNAPWMLLECGYLATSKPQIYGKINFRGLVEEVRGAFAPPIFRRSPTSSFFRAERDKD